MNFNIRQGLLRLDKRLQLILVASIVGVFSGLASVALNMGLKYGALYLKGLRTTWYAILFPGAGAGISIFLLRYVMKDVGDHGVPEVIYSITKRGGLLRLRSSISRLISCLFTIASGGSAGPEAPVVISGASIGSNIASYFWLKDQQRIVIVACGAASAIAAIFNAPATGIIFALEAILGEWTPVNLIPIAIASVAGTEVSRVLQGNQIPFQHREFHIYWFDLIACIGLAILTAFVSVLFIRTLRIVNRYSSRWIKRLWLRAYIGGILVGVIGLVFPDVLGEGYEYIRSIIEEQYAPGVLLAGFSVLAKIFTTSSTLGTGGSGGIFAPCLVVGSFTGLFFQRLLVTIFPHTSWATEGYFGLLGMAGVLSSTLQAPMTGIFLIIEITGGFDVLVSVVLVSVLSSTISHIFHPHSIYHEELIERGELYRPRTDASVLSELSVMELIERDCHIIHPQMKLKELIQVIEKSHRNYYPVEDPDSRKFLGLVYLDDIKPLLFNPSLHESVVVEEIMNQELEIVNPDDNLNEVLEKFDRTGAWSLPVVHGERFLGLISKATLLDHYRKELLAQEPD